VMNLPPEKPKMNWEKERQVKDKWMEERPSVRELTWSRWRGETERESILHQFHSPTSTSQGWSQLARLSKIIKNLFIALA
jgi:succinate dehydrogenase flavin-adding protein (antitoxin of CptAB toxin-antitoxin module)